ncbi:C40 family peptidase [Streptosporangium canum]|uniref:C40 family peptidase n=1 Tax=Streptosporangium canum TaxID=324952 RepID=UPI0036A959B2
MIALARPLITAVVAIVVTFIVIIGLIASGAAPGQNAHPTGDGCLIPAVTTAEHTSTATPLSAEQMRNAQLIAAIVSEQIPAAHTRAAVVIALMTALAESSLRNLDHGDRDSLGLFQQRAGWGSAEQRRDIRYATTAFLGGPAPPANPGLTDIANWHRQPPWAAAQAVQRSAYPDGSNYRRWTATATALADQLLGAHASPDCADPATAPSPAPQAGPRLPGTVPTQVQTAIAWALKALHTPYQWGGKCENPQVKPADPIRQNCDCSSLLQAAYRTAGVVIPRTTFDQVDAGRAVRLDDVAPGDLVFTTGSDGTPSAPGHVGMFIGNGKIIQAPRTGDVVKLTDWAIYRRAVVAVRRVVP